MDARPSDSPASPPRGGPPRGRGRRDLTQGPITRTLLIFSLPLLGGNALQSLNGTVNQIWVSHTLGETAITALGNANIVMMLMMGAIFGVGMASNILIAQAVGGREPALVKRVMGTATTFFMALSLAIAVGGAALSPHILSLMGTPIEARADAVIYLRIIFASAPFMYFFMFLQMALRGTGDSTTPFWFMALAIGIDITLNPLLIRGIGPFPRMGIAGSATSTLVGQSFSLACLIIHLYRRNSLLALWPSELKLLKPDLDILRSLVTRGLPMGVQMLVMSGTAVVMISLVNRFGALTSAAYSISSIIWGYLQMPTMAIGASVSSMAAQNVGAGRWDRVDKVARSGVISGLVVTGTVALLLYVFNDQVLGILLPSNSPAIPWRGISTPRCSGFRPFFGDLLALRRGSVHRGGVGPARHHDHLHAGRSAALCQPADPQIRRRRYLVELPAGHHHLGGSHQSLLSLRRLEAGAHAGRGGHRRSARRRGRGALHGPGQGGGGGRADVISWPHEG